MTTYSDLIERSRNELMTGQSDTINQLQNSPNSSTQTIELLHEAQGVSPGARLTIGLEELHVLAVSNKTVTALRGVGGSLPAAHTANDLVYVNPQFSSFRIGQILNEALRDLSSNGLFRIREFEFDFNPTQAGYDLNAPGIIDIWRVRFDYPGPTKDWPYLNKADYYWDNHADPQAFASGSQIVLLRGGFPGHIVRVSYKAEYAALATLSDDVLAVAGLHTSAHDLPVLYTAYRLNTGREVKRSFLNRQPEPRRQEEVPPGSARGAMEPLLITYYDRLAKERAFLHRKYPEQM
jgi:hypothetical protein